MSEHEKIKYLTKAEAIELMRAGKKITHRYFSYHEWMTMENGLIVLEDGVKCPPAEFWSYRTALGWQADFYEYDPATDF